MTTTAGTTLDTEALRALVPGLASLADPGEDAGRIDQIRLLEELKSAAAAAQAKVTARLVASQTAAQVDAGVRADRVGQGIAAQVALAKRESPARARRYVAWAGVLVRELPCTFAALQEGRTTEWRAQIVARETGWLELDARSQVDAELGPRLEELGDRRVEAEAKKLAYRLDPRGYVDRIRRAEEQRRVTLRPAPDTMSVLSGLLPVVQGVAVHAALGRHADVLRAQGDARSRGQIMADTLVERITGRAVAEESPVEVHLLMTDRTLFNVGDGAGEPAHLLGHGPVPADLARRIALVAAEAGQLWLRRLYSSPASGQLVAMDARSRCFPSGLARFLVLRDQTCRTPWCDAPVRHNDHVVPVEDGGATAAANGQGLCEACNHAKEAAGWSARPGPGGAGHEVVVTTPTGHRYAGRPPDPPGVSGGSRGEVHLGALLAAAA